MKLFGAILLVACALTNQSAYGGYIGQAPNQYYNAPQQQYYAPQQDHSSPQQAAPFNEVFNGIATRISDINSREQYKFYVYKSIADMISLKLKKDIDMIENEPEYNQEAEVLPAPQSVPSSYEPEYNQEVDISPEEVQPAPQSVPSSYEQEAESVPHHVLPKYKHEVESVPQSVETAPHRKLYKYKQKVETVPETVKTAPQKPNYCVSHGEIIELTGPGSLIKMKSERPVVLKLKSNIVKLSTYEKAKILGEKATSDYNQPREYVPMMPNIPPVPAPFGVPSTMGLPAPGFVPIQFLHPYQSTFSGVRLNRFRDRYTPTLGLANFRRG